jgi:hypothetical protein
MITGCNLYVDGKHTAVSSLPEGARRLAVPYIHKRQALRVESCVASLPTQVWAYDYDIAAWVLQRYPAKDKLATDVVPAVAAAVGIPSATDRGTS